MIVISDTSPLTNLCAIGQLQLLRDLYATVLIPVTVERELRVGEENGSHPKFLDTADWIIKREITNYSAVEQLLEVLDRGEAEAIVLASEAGADLLLIDERIGRGAAAGRGLSVIGVLGILVAAKRAGLIEAVRPFIDDLTRRVGFRVSAEVYRLVLLDAGE